MRPKAGLLENSEMRSQFPGSALRKVLGKWRRMKENSMAEKTQRHRQAATEATRTPTTARDTPAQKTLTEATTHKEADAARSAAWRGQRAPWISRIWHQLAGNALAHKGVAAKPAGSDPACGKAALLPHLLPVLPKLPPSGPGSLLWSLLLWLWSLLLRCCRGWCLCKDYALFSSMSGTAQVTS